MSFPIKVILRLYVVCSLLTLIYQFAVRLDDCYGIGACSTSFVKAGIWSLIWPLSWGLRITGSVHQAIFLSIAVLVFLWAARGMIARVFAADYVKRRTKIWLPLYAAGCLITIVYQVGVPIVRCGFGADCNINTFLSALWSLIWPLHWGIQAGGSGAYATLLAALILVLLIVVAEGLEGIFVANQTKIRLRILLSLYCGGCLITFLFQISIPFIHCVGPKACQINFAEGALWALLWPLSWGVSATGQWHQALVISILLFQCLSVIVASFDRFLTTTNSQDRSRRGAQPSRLGFRAELAAGLISPLLLTLPVVADEQLKRILVTFDATRRLRILLSLYVVAGLVTLSSQIGVRSVQCGGSEACFFGFAQAAVWSLLWPLSWGVSATGQWPEASAIAIVLLLLLLLIGIFVNRLSAAPEPLIQPAAERSWLSPRLELVVGFCALLTLIAAEALLTTVSTGMHYGNGDGKLAQATVGTVLGFGEKFAITNINPLQGIGSQLLPLNAWANPAYWPFGMLSAEVAPEVSGVTALACFAIACYLMARAFDVPPWPSIIAAQLSLLLFAPVVAILGLTSVFYNNPGQAVVYAPHIVAVGILNRLEPGRARDFILATAGIFLLLLFSLYCDPLWTMVSGTAWLVPFSVVAMGPLAVRGVGVRIAALACCVALLWISGALEYAYGVSQYTARVQFPDLLYRRPSLAMASILWGGAAPVVYYAICILGWLIGFRALYGRGRVLLAAGAMAFVCFVVYAIAFLVLPINWWLPLPIYLEHCLFPLFTISAVAGLWNGARAALQSARPATVAPEFQGHAPPHGVWPMLRTARQQAIAAVIVALAFVPVISLLFAPRAHTLARQLFQPWPNEPELDQFLADRIGLVLGRTFRGSVTFMAAGEDDSLSMTRLWMRSVPTANEYSQLVTPQALYLNAMLFKKDVKYDLNRFLPWIEGHGSYEVLFKTLQALGVRYIAGHEPFPEADERHFYSTVFPRRSSSEPVGQWQIYELPEPNLGHYSPTEIVIKDSADEIIAALGAPKFDFKRQVVLSAANFSLIPAQRVMLSLIRGGLHISGHSDGRSLIVLPQQFSHCLMARDNAVSLVRANLMMTAVVFSGDIDTDITLEYGIFSPRCRRADLADIKGLAVHLP